MRAISLFLTIGCLLIILVGCSNTEIDSKEVKPQQSSIDLAAKKLESDYSLVRDKIYHVLVDEYLETKDQNNSNIAVLYRDYQVYDGSKNSVYHNIVSVSLTVEIETISQAKAYLETNNPGWLKLKPLTIVNEKVLSQWESEGYQGEFEYWTASPKGLTLEKIINGSD